MAASLKLSYEYRLRFLESYSKDLFDENKKPIQIGSGGDIVDGILIQADTDLPFFSISIKVTRAAGNNMQIFKKVGDVHTIHIAPQILKHFIDRVRCLEE